LKQLGLEPSRPCAKCRLRDLAKPESCIIKGHVFEFRPWKQCYSHLHARLHIIAKHHWNLKLNIFVRRSLSVPFVLRSRSRQVSCRFWHHCFIIGKLQMPTALPGCYIPRYMATIELLLNDTQSHVRHDIWLWLNYCFCWWIPAAHSLTGLSSSSRNPFWRGDWLYLLHLLRYLPIPELQKARAARGNHSNSRWLDKTKSEVRSWRYLLKQLLFGSSILHLQICDNCI
jgi:hypothetical protein